MLGKLMKHEFRATGRFGLPLCGVMLALAVLAGMVLRFWGDLEAYNWHGMTGSVILILYGMSTFAVAIGIFIILMQHFKRNLLGDEGYLMRTLPVSMHELVLSKLFVALLWYLAAAALIALSVLLAGTLAGAMEWYKLDELLRELRRALAGVGAGAWFRIILTGAGVLAFLTLLIYADLAIAQRFSKHRLLYHVMAVAVILVLLRLILGLNGFLDAWLFSPNVSAAGGSIGGADGPASIYVTSSRGDWLGLTELYLSDVLLYFLTWATLRYKPNLE